MELSSGTEAVGLMIAQNFDDAFKIYGQNSYVFRDRFLSLFMKRIHELGLKLNK